jgi:hypothetical protein
MLFFFLIILFLVVGTLVILYSRGIRLDIKNLGFVRTGGIYISSQPSRALISLNGEERENKSGALQRGTLLTNLLPGTYELAISQEGYSNWNKEVEVLPGEVSVFDTVILLSNANPEIVKPGQFTNFDIASGHFAFEGDGGVTLDNLQVFGHEIIELTDGGSLLTRSKNTGNYYLTDESDIENGLNISLIFNNLKEDRLNLPGFIQLKKLIFLPNNDRRFYAATENALYLLDVGRPSLELITTEYNNLNYQSDGTLVWTVNNFVYNFNPTFRNQTEPLDFDKLGIAGHNFIKISKVDNGWLFLDNAGELSYASREFQLIASGISDFDVASNGNLIAITDSAGELFIYDLSTRERFAGIGQRIDQFSWYEDANHILVLENGNIYFRDISAGVPINSYKLAEGVTKFKYDEREKRVFFSKSDGIWEIKL